jgi:hypothetical protein
MAEPYVYSPSFQQGPATGFGFPTSAPGPARQGGRAPQSYWDTTMPIAGRSFGLGSISTRSSGFPEGAGVSDGMTSQEGGGLKRPRLTGDLEGEMPDFALAEPGAKRFAYDPYMDFMGYASAQPHAERFSGASGGDVVRQFGFTGSMLSKHSYSTIGFMTNPSVPANETTIITQPNYESPGEYDLLILRVQLPTEQQNIVINEADGFFFDTSRRTGFTLQGFNHFWASLQDSLEEFVARNSEGVGQPEALAAMALLRMRAAARWEIDQPTAYKEYFLKGIVGDPQDVFRHFYAGGVVNSETFASGQSSVTRHEYGMNPANRKDDVKVNRVDFGRVYCAGIAPPQRRAGSNIWLIAKMVEGTPLYRVDTTHELTPEDVRFAALQHTTISSRTQKLLAKRKYRWQLVPWVSGPGRIRPGPEDLVYEDEFGERKFGYASYIGVIHKENRTDIPVSELELATNLALARTQTPLDFFFSN